MLTTFLVIACQYINVCINDSLDISNLVREIARENTLSSVAEKMFVVCVLLLFLGWLLLDSMLVCFILLAFPRIVSVSDCISADSCIRDMWA